MGKKIGNLLIGEGMPKICVPLTGVTLHELLDECRLASESDVDLVEWRVDFFEYALDFKKVLAALPQIKSALGDCPLLFSFRTKEEGGEKSIEVDQYISLNKEVIASGAVDAIDIELFRGRAVVTELVETAKLHQVTTVISNHDFKGTPSIEEMVRRMGDAVELGGDIPKLAVMPKNEDDVLSLLQASLQLKRKYQNNPLIMIAMGGIGTVSRFSGEIFGSAVTFASLKNASAPGQISVQYMKTILKVIHHAK